MLGSLSRTGAPASDFKYSPLPPGYFRLLTVRRVGEFPIVEMKAFPMEGGPKYEAVSYAWDNSVSSCTFRCNARNYAVSGHVLELLNYLGLVLKGKKLWIDAICINQEDGAEKSIQVAKMQQIYYQAERVVVWLGVSNNDSDLVIDNLGYFVDWGTRIYDQNLTPIHKEYKTQVITPPASLCHSLGRFLMRPWFHRVWVVQEMVLAKETILVCGNRQMNWDTFCNAVLLFQYNGLELLLAPILSPSRSLVAVAMANIDELNRLRQKGAHAGLSTVNFIKLLKMGRFRKVTEPVDRVWGFLGLADEELRVSATPFISYSSERRREYYRAYADLGKLLLQRDPELYLLSIVPSVTRSCAMPSWCPDFHAAGLNGYSIQSQDNLAFHSGQAQNTEGKTLIEFGPGAYTLRLEGFRLDKVDKVIAINFESPSSWEEERIQAAKVENVGLWDRQCLTLARATVGPGFAAAWDAHWRTLSFDQIGDQPRHVLREAYLNFRYFANLMPYPGNLTTVARKAVNTFTKMVHKSCSRAYFNTSGGRIGLGPRNMAVGDWVCIIYGAKVPYILRSRPASTLMEFIGDSYVDGVMYGESLKDGNRPEVFSLN